MLKNLVPVPFFVQNFALWEKRSELVIIFI